MYEDTTVTLLTPPGRGALATIAVEGTLAASLVGAQFEAASGSPLKTLQLRRIVPGRWKHANGTSEEIIVCRRTNRVVEVHCHGGSAASNSILMALVTQGARRIDSRTWIQAQAQDSIQAVASLALAEVGTERAARVLLDQYHGALRRALLKAVRCQASGKTELSHALLTRLADLGRLGCRLTSTWRVVCAGPPNVGKSSLVNAMLGFERAIVLNQPGTTRDLVSTQTAFDGWPIELTDTAGLRLHADSIEREAGSRAREAMALADLVVLVFDATQAIQPAHQAQLDSLTGALVVANKTDLCLESPDRSWSGLGRQVVLTSALVGTGMDALMNAIVTRLVPQVPSAGEAVPFTVEQCQTIEQALSLYASGDPAAGARRLSALI